MHILFHINHPAQYHMFKYVIATLKSDGNKVSIIARNKDVLTNLMDNDGVSYVNTHKAPRENNLVSLFINYAIQYFRIKKIIKEKKPDLLVGTSFIFPYISKKLKIPYINIVEDDSDVIPLYAKMSMSKSDYIFAPQVCQLGKWEKKKIGYNSFHELAFLHPNHFSPCKKVAEKYIDVSKKNFLIRFTEFSAHHDYGKKGVDLKTAQELIEELSPLGTILISSERDLPRNLEKYRLTINPNDVHHVMAHCTLIIGDSQSMAMEAACLGVPSIRFSDYAGRISVLEELEHKYKLTFAFTPKEKKTFLEKVKSLLKDEKIKTIFQERKKRMLQDKSDTHLLMSWLIGAFPESINTIKKTPHFITQFGGEFTEPKKYKLHKGTTSKVFYFSIIYITTLLFLYLFPLSDQISLNKQHYLSFRGDHLIHLIVFAPIPFLMLPLFLKQTKNRIFKVTFFSLVIAILFELTHILTPYRSFTVEDLSANIFGVLIGGIVIFLWNKIQK